ncbi:MAG: hypothetical protein ACQKHC_01660 [Candidatus Phytoplasma pruni]
MTTKQHHYDLNTKLKVIFAKKEGLLSNKQIQAKYKIKNKTQIYKWLALFDKQQIHHLQQPTGKQYKYAKGLYGNQDEKEIKKIKLEIKKILEQNNLKKNKNLYFDIINKYKNKMTLNQLLKCLGLAKTTYYRWLKNYINTN